MEFDKDKLINTVLDTLKDYDFSSELFEKNIKTLSFRDVSDIYSKLSNIASRTGEYAPEINTIFYTKNNDNLDKTIIHELLHVASTRTVGKIDNIDDIEVKRIGGLTYIPYSGLCSKTYDLMNFCFAINEGITIYIIITMLSKDDDKISIHPAYLNMAKFVNFIFMLIGPVKVLEYYFENDCEGFYNEMHKYFGNDFIKVICACEDYFKICLDKLCVSPVYNKIVDLSEKRMIMTYLRALYSNNENKSIPDDRLEEIIRKYYYKNPKIGININKEAKKLAKKYNVSTI